VVQTLQLRPYQHQAADFLYENDRAMILAPVGAGKTAITLTAMQAMLDDGHVKRWLVVAPKRVCTDVWPVEAPKWSGITPALAVGSPAQRAAAVRSDASVVVINYDNLDKLDDLSGFDGIVFDELTRLKNPSGKRFKALEKLLANVKVRWGLTGSFTSNGLEDVFGQCKIVDQSLLGRSKGAFLQQYFICINRDFGQWAPGASALEQVMARIKPATFVLEPGEYKDKLPPCHVTEVRVAMDDRAPYEKMKRDYVVRFGSDQIIAQNAASVTTKLQQMASGFVYRGGAGHEGHWHFHPKESASVAKGSIWFSTHKFDRLEELLAENQRANTIVAYTYQEELAELKRRFPHAQTMNDDNVIERWNRGEIELLLVHPKSAGHGLNLQHGGCHMVFLSLPWSLELYEQTVGRLHRSGQTRDVWVYVMLTEKTIDERIWAALHDKRAVSDVALEELKNG
jgi:SNF2 family DNA or RNA helicase